jgi:hypothetical protein
MYGNGTRISHFVPFIRRCAVGFKIHDRDILTDTGVISYRDLTGRTDKDIIIGGHIITNRYSCTFHPCLKFYTSSIMETSAPGPKDAVLSDFYPPFAPDQGSLRKYGHIVERIWRSGKKIR